MKILFWNVRGLVNPRKQDEIRNLIKQKDISIFGVLETRLKATTLSNFMKNKFTNWKCAHNFDTFLGGRIVVVWDPSRVDFNPKITTAQIIHGTLFCHVRKVNFELSFIYALNNLVLRRDLWSSLSCIGNGSNLPWALIGDFNNILFPHERVNGRPVTVYETKDFLEACSFNAIEDLPFHGPLLTWTNNDQWCKLDRAMVNSTWIEEGIVGHVEFSHPGCHSDHAHGIVTLLDINQKPKPPFRFFNMWTKHPSYLDIVKTEWDKNIQGTKQFQVFTKLKLLKGVLKQLNTRHFSHISERYNKANNKLVEMQQQLHDDPQNDFLKTQMGTLRKEALRLGDAEKSFYQQKAKLTFNLQSDRGSKFYHSLVKGKQGRNFISGLTLGDGSSTTSSEQVVDEFVKYYSGLLGTKHPRVPLCQGVINQGPKVTDEQAHALIAPIEDVEIQNAIFGIGEDKSPGPDGYTSAFFKGTWSTVGSLVMESIREFFERDALLKQLNNATVALIPKGKNSPTVSDFRPISCCNVIYKAITKIIATRLAPILDGLLDMAQGAFVPGRSMAENIFLVQELIRRYGRKRISPRAIIKIDLRKAFDTIDWDFLEEMLGALKFPRRFVKWIMLCVRTPSYSLSINGGIHGFFPGKQGLRQGDPLSPFLFILSLEYLSRLLKSNTGEDFNYHPQCDKLKLTHLAFADDLMLFSRGDEGSIQILMDAMKEFGEVTGLKLNVSKSNVYLAGVNEQDSRSILELSHLTRGDYPFRYLGVPIVAESMKVIHYTPLLDKLWNYINGWNAKSLSYAGRLELIKSIFQGVEAFWLSIFPIPATIRDHITKISRVFLWGSPYGPVAWKSLCIPKEEGGLGIRELGIWNHALMGKLIWSLHDNKEALWIKWIHAYYLKNANVWTWSPPRDASPMIKFLFATRDKLIEVAGTIERAKEFLSKVMGTGRTLAKSSPSGMIYNLLRPRCLRKPWANIVWSSPSTPKHSYILWLATLGRLRTKDRIEFLDIDHLCTFCKSQTETIDHLYFTCSFTSLI